ncbi:MULTISPECIES: L,D-transpeptidase family protein [Alkalihalophilus]|uniref:L,D-transpeptidase family protein n=1 Tax=Alkalihalophilus pseudofirmus TaxID=79885 RepID=A0AAJ2NR96_ALKPS|nr:MULTISPECIES: L,D-transpeptidase family protein [Alkalihalophilus]MDV2887053.1 L,D-transpeptidase family protein [Alkalihalophilus pseudofirmus]MEC2071952.1 L,D-transpeptidase family protein [Alkalihalophilus marmarensis]MED1600889.1 L,D-transpeptidase family protein [Alkalihalophilus marmarensis]
MYQHIVLPGETLFSISEDYRTPYQAILAANQIPNPNMIYVGQPIVIPGIPDPALIPFFIDVSISNRTLSLYENEQLQKVYPIAVGRMLYDTPVGDFIIVNREPNPGGPFGTLWLSLSKKSYGIHGTNDPSSIGHAVSKGCIRMFNQDVEELGSIVPNGTRVRIRP